MTLAETQSPAAPTRRRLGDLLVDEGLIDHEQLAWALEEQRRSGERLGRVLVDAGLLTEAQLLHALARHLGLPSVDLEEQVPDFAVARLLREPFARRHGALPVALVDGSLLVAMVNPTDVFTLDDIRSLTGHKVKPVLAEPGQLTRAIDRVWTSKAEEMMRIASDSVVEEEAERVPAAGRDEATDAPVVQFVNELLVRAVNERASDVHLEPSEHELRVRFRIDGVLHDVMAVPRSIRSSVISRVKIMADLDIAERRLPQDGRVTFAVAGRAVDVRAVSLPTTHGEAIVLRVLDRATGVLRLEELGFAPSTLASYQACFQRPWGAVLATGPTGSGKSTTLYATLGELNTPDRNIVTVEDPVEYHLGGVKQVHVNRKAGLTFASALRSIVRADPDVILVGEVRDRETATIAVEAALTGHLVFTTLHANDAASTPARLLDMGVEPFLVTSAVTGVLAQRLVRRLCDRCREPYSPGQAELAAAGWDDELRAALPEPTFFRAVGCQRCARSGYHGRAAVQEVMPLTEDLAHLVLALAPSDQVQARAVELGMTTLRRDGLAKVGAGVTTFEELLRVVV